MWKNYLQLSFRNLKRNKGYAAINVVGLAFGLAACFLIFLFVRHELSYDAFHEKSDRIYRIARHVQIKENERTSLRHSANLASFLSKGVPEVENVVRLFPMLTNASVTRGERSFYEDQSFYADTSFFDIFTFPLTRGNPETALSKPFSLVVTQETARKYFGEKNPIGKTLQVKGRWQTQDYTITGVAENLPSNSHFHFDLVASLSTLRQTSPWEKPLNSWSPAAYYTYVLLKEGHGPEDLRPELADLSAERSREFITTEYPLQPLTSIHLHSHYDRELEAGSDPRYLYIFSGIALLILLVACINYMNLATARSARRAKEVGVRKAVGAHRFQLMRQFLGEALLFSMLAFLIALLLTRGLLPFFSEVIGKALSFSFSKDLTALAAFFGISMLMGFFAGSYPAFALSRFQPASVLRGLLPKGSSYALFRKGLVVFQFGVSVALIAATIICWRQFSYMQAKNLGIEDEHVVAIHARDALMENRNPARYLAFKKELLQHANIRSIATASQDLPAPQTAKDALVPEGVDREEWRSQEKADLNSIGVDPDFLETLDIPLVKGRGLPPGRSDEGEYQPVLINQAMVNALGWEDPLGKTFPCCTRPTPRVVGVVSDFHYQTLKDQIEPLMIMKWYNPRYVMVRVQPQDLGGALATIRKTWNDVTGGMPFDYSFLDQRFDQIYQAEKRLATVFGAFSILAILIACLGLLGLAAYMAERRTKEIGIRKVLGASVTNIATLLSKDFLRLILIAFIIAAPLAYYAMSRWLEDFAYRVELEMWIFIGAGTLALAVALLTVSYQALRAALANPVDAIQYE